LLASSHCNAKETSSFYTIACDPWVNVIAITEENQVVLVEQYRHGIEGLTLEIPGGCVDVTDSDPCAAAVRELREETGYIADRWSFLGKNHPNPALQNNLCYTYLAEGVRLIESPQFDGSGTEKINTHLVNLSDIGSLIRDGNISHALVITAFHFLTLERPELSIMPRA
jgi:8-oxo-dGTP pyrophosphatase MutT (NUDIX family)